ncbi:MAG: ferrochelatase [Acidimicrobiales bacterium]
MTRSGSRENEPFGVVVMAYGTPRSPADVEAYYTHIRRGRPPSPGQLADLARRYDAIGGISPLAERTEGQRVGLQAALDARSPGRATVVLGQKHAAPFIEEAVDDLAAAGLRRVVGLVLAPHFSAFSVGEYQRRLADAARPLGLTTAAIESWHLEEAYLSFLTDAVIEALPADHKVLFTAHSLPERVLADDPYPDQLRQSATAVAERVGLTPWVDWSIAWQSAGATPEPWRGPDVLQVLRALGAEPRPRRQPLGVCVCAQGFVADHLEVLYDLDIEAAGVAAEAGLTFARTRSLNDDPQVLATLADRVLATAEHGSVSA